MSKIFKILKSLQEQKNATVEMATQGAYSLVGRQAPVRSSAVSQEGADIRKPFMVHDILMTIILVLTPILLVTSFKSSREVKTLRKGTVALAKQIQTQNQKIEAMNGSVIKVSKDIEKYFADVNSLDGKIKGIAADLKTSKEQSAHFTTDLRQMTTRLSQLEKNQEKFLSEFKAFKKNIETRLENTSIVPDSVVK